MKKTKLIIIPILLSLALIGCNGNADEEKTIEDVTIEKIDVKDTLPQTPSEMDLNNEELARESDFQDELTEPLGDYGVEVIDRGAIIELSPLKDIKNPEQFKADLDTYLIYCFPDIDKRYNASVINGSERNDQVCYSFKVKVEGIMTDGTDLTIECLWANCVGTEHYNFFSDLTPEGTQYRVDKDGNIITYD